MVVDYNLNHYNANKSTVWEVGNHVKTEQKQNTNRQLLQYFKNIESTRLLTMISVFTLS